MWAVLALGACAWAMPEVVVTPTDHVSTVPILLFSPPGFDSRLRGSDVLDATARLLDRAAGARGLSPEQAGLALDALDRCGVADRYACALRLVRELPASSRSSGWAMMVLLRPTAQADERLDVVLVDIERAADAMARPIPGEPAEDAIFRHARTFPPVMRGPARDATELAQTLELALGTAIAELLPRPRFGRIDLSLACAPCEVALDGRVLATADGPALTLVQVPVGAHHLTLRRGMDARDVAVVVPAERAIAVDTRDFGAPPVDGLSRAVLVGAGGAAIAGGVVLMVVARASSAGVVCLESASDRCPAPGPFARIGSDGLVAQPAFDPLFIAGAGLAGAGASWGGAGVLTEALSPAWAAVIAVAGASVGTAIALAGGTPR